MNNLIKFFKIALISNLCLLFLLSCDKKSQQPIKKPNVVIILTDDQGYGDVSALNPGSKFQTPNIDKLANEGIIFTDGHSSDAVCSPSRYSLLTGRYSWRTTLKTGVLGADGPCLIKKGRMTIASMLKENGYNTGMVGKWHLQMDFAGTKGKDRDWSKPFTDGPIEKGFDYFFGIPASMNFGVLTYLENDKVLEAPTVWTHKTKSKNPLSGPSDFSFQPPYSDTPNKGWIEVAPDFDENEVLKTLTSKAVGYINKVAEDAKKGKPFFLYFALTSPHLPHCTHPDFRGKTECGNYGDFMAETDYRVGQILDALKSQGLTDNTLVIFTSDNGAETNYNYQRKKYGHYSSYIFKGGKRDIYEGGHHIPFIMRWPNVIKAGSKSTLPVCQTDYFATLADIVGAKIPDNAAEDSYSLYPVLKGEKYDNSLVGPVIHHSCNGYFAIRDGKWKLNMVRGSGGTLKPKLIIPKKGEALYELYNIEEDPSETKNLYFEHPEIVEKLTKEITSIIKNGRTTKGEPQPYVKENMPQVTWTDL